MAQCPVRSKLPHMDKAPMGPEDAGTEQEGRKSGTRRNKSPATRSGWRGRRALLCEPLDVDHLRASCHTRPASATAAVNAITQRLALVHSPCISRAQEQWCSAGRAAFAQEWPAALHMCPPTRTCASPVRVLQCEDALRTRVLQRFTRGLPTGTSDRRTMQHRSSVCRRTRWCSTSESGQGTG